MNRLSKMLQSLVDSKLSLWLVLLLAFSIRIGMGFFFGINTPPDRRAMGADTVEFEQMGWSAAQGNGFVSSPGQAPTAFRAPGYPMLLCVLYKVFGHQYFVNRVALSVIGALTCWLVYLLAVSLNLGRGLALLSMFLTAVLPLQFYYCGHFMSDPLATFFNVLCCLLMVLALNHIPRNTEASVKGSLHVVKLLFLAGISCGLSTLTRPNSILVPMSFFFLMVISKKYSWRQTIVWSAVLAVSTVLAVVPWTVRNAVLFQRFALVSTNGGATFWGSNNAIVAKPFSYKWGYWVSGFDREVKKKEVSCLPNEVDRGRMQMELGRRFLKQNPKKIPMLLIGKFYSLLTPFPKSSNKIFVLIIAASQVFLLPLALMGIVIVVMDANLRNKFLPVFAQLLVLMATVAVFYGSERFRSSYEPFLGLFWAVAVRRLVCRFKTEEGML